MESALLDRHPRLRNRRLQQLAGRLGDLYGAIKALSLNVRKWERQVNNLHKCVVVHERWISHAQR